MPETKSYENFPLWMPLIAVIVSIIGYILGAFILSGFGLLIVVIYLIYCFGIELLIIFRSCKDCYGRKLWGIGLVRTFPCAFQICDFDQDLFLFGY